jgi:transposase
MMRDMKGGEYRRVEVLTGPGRRRVWDEATKAQVVAESDAPGAVISAVARRWQIAPQQLFTWRREARAASLAVGRGEAAFVPILAEPPLAARAAVGPGLEVVLAGAVVRVSPGVDPGLLSTVLRAVRGSEP